MRLAVLALQLIAIWVGAVTIYQMHVDAEMLREAATSMSNDLNQIESDVEEMKLWIEAHR